MAGALQPIYMGIPHSLHSGSLTTIDAGHKSIDKFHYQNHIKRCTGCRAAPLLQAKITNSSSSSLPLKDARKGGAASQERREIKIAISCRLSHLPKLVIRTSSPNLHIDLAIKIGLKPTRHIVQRNNNILTYVVHSITSFCAYARCLTYLLPLIHLTH